MLEYISPDIIKKYSTNGPRYTSYPTVPAWKEVDQETQLKWIQTNKNSQRPISLYVHIPFCEKQCYFCGCNVVITKDHSQSAPYLHCLLKELDQLRATFSKERKILQLHLGGGTPSFLTPKELETLIRAIKDRFPFEEEAEIALEADPRVTTIEQLQTLRSLGFNRISFGVQDFNKKVQNTINRIQSEEITWNLLNESRKLGFKGANFDLIYGLPFQTTESFNETLKIVKQMRPDRLAVYHFAFLPKSLPYQRRFDEKDLPNSNIKTEIFWNCLKEFLGAGYEYIGMDHFALPEDELTKAQKNKTLYRNFMGYTAKSGFDMYGLGVSAIGETEHYFLQNTKKLSNYKSLIQEGKLTGAKGLQLTKEDQIRKWVILELMCNFNLNFSAFEQKFQNSLATYFSEELKQLNHFQEDSLLQIDSHQIQILPKGKLFVRNICMVFDAYLPQQKDQITFSKTL